MDKLIGTIGAAQILGISPSGVTKWLGQGRIPDPIGRLEPRGDRVWRESDIRNAAQTPAGQRRTPRIRAKQAA